MSFSVSVGSSIGFTRTCLVVFGAFMAALCM
jgi:hypothetical protein